MIYFSYYLMQEEEFEQNFWEFITKVCVYVTSIYFAWLEWLQIKDKRLSIYMSELTNYMDVGSIILNFVLVFKQDFFRNSWYSFNTQKTLAAIACACIWYKTFYWMRLFTSTAFFINLLTETLFGISAFVTMMAILLLGVSNVMYILNIQNEDLAEDLQQRPIFTMELPWNFVNSVIFSYKLVLGEFDTEGFDGNHAVVLWLIFFGATFLLQITFLNMLIAIMQDTFTDVKSQ